MGVVHRFEFINTVRDNVAGGFGARPKATRAFDRAQTFVKNRIERNDIHEPK